MVPMTHRLSTEQLERFRSDGFIMVEGLFSSATMRAALNASDDIAYGMSFDKYLEYFVFDDTGNIVANRIDPDFKPGRGKFPTGIAPIDQLIADDGLLNIFEQCLGTSEIRFCNAHLFTRTGPTDTRYKPNPWEGYHIDHDTESYLPPASYLDGYAYVNCHILLHDIDSDCAPMQVIPGSHYLVAEHFADYCKQEFLSDRGNFADIRKLHGLSTSVSVEGLSGSAFFYSSYLIHSAIPFQNKKSQRALFTITMFRSDNNSWKRLSWPYTFLDRPLANGFCAQTTTRARTVLGWPPPGHPYYTADTLTLLSKWYPGIDLTDYKEALTNLHTV
jgi:Phytanoyl-CoA dioxygenase (PhyH)